MHITCSQPDLKHALSAVGHAISNRSTLPILANVLFIADPEQNCLTLAATNLEIGITCRIPAEIQEEGRTTVPAKTMTDLVSSLRPGPTELSATKDTHIMSIQSAGNSATIKRLDPAEFPHLPSAEGGEPPVVMDTSLLKEMIAQVAFAAADDDSRPVLTGVHVEVGNETLTFAAADAFHLAVRSAALPSENLERGNLLLPAKTLIELARILPSEGTVQMVVTPTRNQVLFHTEHIDLVSRLIEGTFPNYRQIIPNDYTTRAVVETKEFAAAVKTVTPFARDSSNIARVNIAGGSNEGSSGTLTIEATAEDIGSNISTLNASVVGPEQHIIFNVKYLSDILAVIDTPEVALELISAAKPGVMKPVGSTEATYIIMPMSSSR